MFFPNHGHKPTLTEMEKMNDGKCVWMREDFMRESGGQGDLRDEVQQILLDDEVEAEPEEEEEQRQQEAALVQTLPETGEIGQGEERRVWRWSM